MIKIFIHGRTGKMGNVLSNVISNSAKFVESSMEECDVVIDFTSSDGLSKIIKECLRLNKPLVSGTTGLSESVKNELSNATGIIPIVHRYNFSEIFNWMTDWLLNFPKTPTNIYIVETHHISKKDVPSGTALGLRELIRSFWKIDPDIHSIRKDEKIGEHTINIQFENEKLSITHIAESREVFAKRALECAKDLVTS